MSDRIKSLSDLSKLGFRGSPPSAKKPEPPPPAGSKPKTCKIVRESVRITQKDRAGRAPYNFVPLPDPGPDPKSPAWIVPRPPTAEAFTGISGEISLEIQALTDFFIRGMWSLGDFAAGKEVKDQTRPFEVDGKLRVPGTALRGMIRNLVEILSKAPLDPVNDSQMFFRAVGASDNPQNFTSFEPQAVAYKSRIIRGEAGTDRRANLAVRVGYLYGSREAWKIRPAKADEVGAQWYRFRTRDLWERRRVTFVPDRPPWANLCLPQTPNARQGWLVCSGFIQKKQSQWIVCEEDSTAEFVEIPEADVTAYRESGITQEIERRKFGYSESSKGIPCFYVEWPDADGVRHISFGHTPFLRIPYTNTVRMTVPPGNSRKGFETQWDMAQAIFGRTPDAQRDGHKGRVDFEDGLLVSRAAVNSRPEEVVLGTPKPTTFQHYVVQTSEDVNRSIHWDGNYRNDKDICAVPRGHKLYWHRPDAPIRLAESDQAKVASRFQRAGKGAVFQATVRFRNLTEQELGVLLTALDLPPGCAHKLGMAKALGLGSFQIRVSDVRQIDRVARYRSFFAAGILGDTLLETGASSVLPLVPQYKQAFAAWYLNPRLPDVNALWDVPRLKELKALLTYQGLPKDWAAITRCLEFGKVANYNERRNYNEYLNVGHPDRPRPLLQKRRPLPPATQVLNAGPEIPKDPRPPFIAVDRDRPGQGGERR